MSEEGAPNGTGTVPWSRFEKVMTEREKLREALKSKDLEIATLHDKYKDAEKIETRATTLAAELEALKGSVSLRDKHDALKDAGITGKSARDYFLLSVPEGTDPAAHLEAVRKMETIEDDVLANIVRVEEGKPAGKPGTPGRPSGTPAKHVGRSAADWEALFATGTTEELQAALPEIRAAGPQYASAAAGIEAMIARAAPAG